LKLENRPGFPALDSYKDTYIQQTCGKLHDMFIFQHHNSLLTTQIAMPSAGLLKIVYVNMYNLSLPMLQYDTIQYDTVDLHAIKS